MCETTDYQTKRISSICVDILRIELLTLKTEKHFDLSPFLNCRYLASYVQSLCLTTKLSLPERDDESISSYAENIWLHKENGTLSEILIEALCVINIMSMKDKKVASVVESDEENEQGACGITNDPRRSSLAVPEPLQGGLLDDSVDNLSMEVHVGGDNSRHPSEISSISYQNLLDDGEPSNSIISRRGSDDSLDSYPPDFPDAELPPDDLETFEASDLPLSEHFPMGALQGAESKEKTKGERCSHLTDSSSNLSRPNVKLKDPPSSVSGDAVKLRDKHPSENENLSNADREGGNIKRNSLEIRNNIPVLGEVKDYEKELNIDFSRGQGPKPKMIGLKQSPGLARRVDIEIDGEKEISNSEKDFQKQDEIVPAAPNQPPSNLKPKSTSGKPKENVIEVITPIPKNMNIENEYDYVKYARVQQGNSYVGMRLAYSSSNDSLNLKQGVGSDNSSREPSPEKCLQQKILSELSGQGKVSEETLTEIPLNSSDYPEDKKAFTLSPENTECDSVEVESVTSEGENSTPGFPTVEDGLSSSQASDADEGTSGHGNDRSPSKMLKSKQKAAIDQDLLKDEEECQPKEMDAQAIMDDLKMKREALDMAIADIKSAIQRSKNVSLETPFSSQQDSEETQPVWVKRDTRETTNQLQRRQEEMRRVREEIERQQEELSPAQGKPHQEKAEGNMTQQDQGNKINEEQNITQNESDTFSDQLKTTATNCLSEAAVVDSSGEQSSPHNPGTVVVVEEGNGFTGRTDTSFVMSNQIVSQDNEDSIIVCSSHEGVLQVNNVDDADVSNNMKSNSHGIPKLETISHGCAGATENYIDTKYSFSEIHKTNTCEDLERHANLDINENNAGIEVEGENLNHSDIEQETRHATNKAIHAVSNDIILNLGSSFMKATVIPSKADIVAEETVQLDVTDSCVQCNTHIYEFDHLAPSQPSHEEEQIVGPENDYVSGSISFDLCETGAVSDDTNIGELQSTSSASLVNVDSDDSEDEDNDQCSENDEQDSETPTENSEVHRPPEDADGLVGRIRRDGLPRGYDSDDECEDAEGIRYTRRNKGKKYAPLQKDDSLEMGGACGGSRRSAAKANGQMFSNNRGAHMGSNGSVVSHTEASHQLQQSGEHHIHHMEAQLSSEESSDIDANIRSYTRPPHADSDTDEETDRLLQKQYEERDKHVEIPELNDPAAAARRSEADRRQSKAKEAAIRDPDRPEVLIEGVLFRARYLGSTQLISEGQPSKAMRMMQAQEAVGRIKAPEGENQPSTDVDLFVSTEKIMVLNTDLQEIMMDHSLRTISYIADIGDILVIMARRRLITSPDDVLGRRRRQAKILCHVFESEEAQLIAQSIGQAFQVAYLEFLKANGIEDPGLLKEMDYQDVLNQQEIYGEELNLFANKDFHKEVIVPKSKNEPLGVVIVESGWGSMVPTVVLANMLPTGPAARCGQLNIGDQIISINGISLVGLPLSACQTYIKASRSQTVVKLTVVPCPPVVEVLIKRPDVKYQLGFSVQNGVICSLLRGGIAERGGVRVGHRIIEINNQSVVAVPHEKIVTLLASSVGEIHMKTMPTSIFRLLTGQDVPHYL